MRSNFLRSLTASFLMCLLVFLPFSQDNGFLQFVFADDSGWGDYDNYIVIDQDETWEGEKIFTDTAKPIVVVNGATLTIEKGSHIKFGSLFVYDGRIVALGTEKEKIIFTKQEQDLSWVSPQDLEQYDKKCFMGENGMLEFSDWVETAEEEPSFFRYVEFDGMGTYFQYDSDNCPSVSINDNYWNIFNTVRAESRTVHNPALRFNSGKLHIENSSFKNNAYSDIEANMEFNDEQESYDYLWVINSNFEGNIQNTALISQFKYVGDSNGNYAHHLLLKNNWYGDSFGPREMPDYLLGGEKIIGDYIRVTNSVVEGKWEHGMPENFYDNKTDRGLENSYGDETVPLTSAKDIVADDVIEIEAAHGDLPTKAQCKIFSELAGKLESECKYDEDFHIPNILLFNVFSPIDIQVISPLGKKMGKNFETGEIYNEIPGAYYTGYDTANEFITIPNPEDGEYRILTQGTGEGAYRIEAVKITEGVTSNQEAKESVATLTGTAIKDVMEEKKIELLPDDTVVPKEDKEDNDTIAPAITISSPENKSYLNNQVLPIVYTISDDISPIEKITKEVKLDDNIFDQTTIDLSLQTLGNHTLSVQATDEASNEAEQSVNFENTTTFDSLKKNIDHYFSIGLIKNKREVKYIQAFLLYLEKLEETINYLKNMPYFPPQAKARLTQKFQRELEYQKKRFFKYLEQRVEKGIIDIKAKDRIAEAVEKLVN